MSSLVDQGFPGLAIWLSIMAMIWFRLRRHRRWAGQQRDLSQGWLIAGLAAMFAVVVTAGMFAPLIRTEVYVWILALTCALDRFSLATESSTQREPSMGTSKPLLPAGALPRTRA